MPVVCFDAADQSPLEIVHGREQRQSAMANVVMGLRSDMADAQG